MKRLESDLLVEISNKLNVLIAFAIRSRSDDDFNAKGKRKGSIGNVVTYLSGMGLSSNDIAAITGSPITSVRTFLTPSRKK